MTKFHFLEKLEVILNSFIISLVASFVRLIFYRTGSFMKTILVFFGGIVFGTLVGYLIDGVAALQSFDKVLIAGSAIAAKEIIEWLIVGMPKLLKRYTYKKIDTITGNQDDPIDRE